MCGTLNIRNDHIQSALDGLIYYITEYNGRECYETYHYADYVANMRDTALIQEYPRYGYRQTLYEQCSQFGWFATTESKKQPFGRHIPLSFFTQLCIDVFGAEVVANAAENVERFNVQHGGLQLRVSHVLFTNAELDPHRSLLVREPIGDEVVVRQLAGQSWSYDFYKPSEYDDAEMKQQNLETVRSWL